MSATGHLMDAQYLFSSTYCQRAFLLQAKKSAYCGQCATKRGEKHEKENIQMLDFSFLCLISHKDVRKMK